MYHHFYSRKNIEDLAEGVKSVLVTNYRIKELEKQLAFSDTTANKILLADEHFAVGNNQKAINLYQSCLTGIDKDDPSLLKKLIRVCYFERQYHLVIEYGEKLIPEKTFNIAIEKAYYAWSKHLTGKEAEAEDIFQSMDIRFSNYIQRIEYAKFLYETGSEELALEKLSELYAEIESMDRHEKRSKKAIAKEIRELYAEYDQ